jgi:hypothetical protein
MASNIQTIASHARHCVSLFNEYLLKPDQEIADLSREQQARFNLWAANIGVFADSPASLDSRLEEHPDVRAMVLRALTVLGRNLKRGTNAYFVTVVVALIQTPTAIDVATDPPTEILRTEKRGSFDRNSSSSSSLGSASSFVSKASQMSAAISRRFVPASEKFLKIAKTTIDQLQRLSISIRKSSVRSRNSRASNFIARDVEGNDITSIFESYAVSLVKARHSNASDALRKRLGAAMLLRRRRFLYRQRGQL